jgi:nucleoside-diphosphate-sugar epimerase
MATVLVTGGSGYIASYCILALLAEGHDVRTTVRSLAREADVRAMLKRGGAEPGNRLSFHAADLANDAGWAEAVRGCDYILHVASPTLTSQPKHEDEMIVPAREGVLRVLRAARDAGVKRVVLTSAFGAIGYGHAPRQKPFDETDWTELNDTVAPYQKSKTLAERAAWDFVATEGNGLELAAVHPVAVLGPVLGPDYSPSLGLIKRLLAGEMPFLPKFSVGWVDVRDVADLHVRAMTDPAANGQRFLAISGHAISVRDLALMLRRNLGPAASRVPAFEMPTTIMRLLARFNPGVAMLLPTLGKVMDATSAKATALLGWQPRPLETSVVETARSLLALKP